LPCILPLLLTQHPARTTPVQLSTILDVPARLRCVIGTPIELTLHVDDFAGSILGDRKAPRATRALVELARALLHAYKNPRSVTKLRMAELARQFEILVRHRRPDDVTALCVYVISVFDRRSPLREMLMNAVDQPAKEMYMTIEKDLLARGKRIGKKLGKAEGRKLGEAEGRKLGNAEGRKLGKAEGKAEAVLGVLAYREVPVPATVRERVLASRDELELQRWFDRAFTVASARELFEPRCPSRSRSNVEGTRMSRGGAGRRTVAA
jgi:hypothetical protein